MEMKINEVAKLCGVTVRTLHYYHQIGLLSPSQVTQAGYRLYGERELAVLQQILFFRELDFSLEQIREMMTSPGFDEKAALRSQKQLLLKKRERLDRLIGLVEHTIEGGTEMSFQEFDSTEIEAAKEQYAAEVKERWGSTPAYRESEEKTSRYGKADWRQIDEEGADIFRALAAGMDKDPGDPQIQKLVQQWQEFITARFYRCTKEILQGLGLMYLQDERFRKNIDRYGDGLAEFFSQAIAIYCK